MKANEQVYDRIVEEDSGRRIDQFLAAENEEFSRAQIQHWVKEGRVQVNGRKVKANYKLKTDDLITFQVPLPEKVDIRPEPIPLDIRYEDADVLVVHKPRGLVVHPAPGHHSGTLVNGLLAYCQQLSTVNGDWRPGIVHRLDKDTSGLLMIAKNDQAHLSLAAQLKAHTVTRRYIAIVHGSVAHAEGTIDAPIGRHPKQRQQMGVHSGGKEAVTHFHVLEHFPDHTLVELELETGRTHQIRVHLKYIGHPLAGDPKYGPSKTLPLAGQALHAKILGFDHPRSGQRLEFDSNPPEDIQRLIDNLRIQRETQ